MNQKLLTPIAIVVAGTLIALALFARGGSTVITADSTPYRPAGGHIYGNTDAAVKIVEFSDYECPFCGRLHTTLERLVDESAGQVSWEFRHRPLSMHRNAAGAAMAAECAAELGGNDIFWRYSQLLFDNQRNLNPALYENLAASFGIKINEFNNCLQDPDIASQVAIDDVTAIAFGGQATPHSVVVFPDGSIRPVSGALPYENWQALIAQ